jgi:predicted DNA-binding protein (MmcQ/YjbR family)
MTKDPLHDRLLAIVSKLPGAYEDRPWGSVHCKVDGKIFVGWGRHDDGEMSIGIRVPIEDQLHLVETDRRFTIAKYSGKYGGVDMRIGEKPDWKEIERYIVGSYRAVAPKKRVKELDALLASGAGSTPPRATAKARVTPKRKATAKRGPAPKRGRT